FWILAMKINSWIQFLQYVSTSSMKEVSSFREPMLTSIKAMTGSLIHRQRARGYPFQPNPLPFIVSPQYFVLLLCIFLLEILAGVLAYIYYQQLNEELKQNLRETMVQKYRQPEQEHVTKAVDKLQHEFKCCGSNSSSDWGESVWIRTSEADGRLVPDSCCKTQTLGCGRRDHPSNIYKVEGGCITKLENFILDHLKIIGAVGVGIACVQIVGMVFTCCLYRSLKAEPY
uniref:CD151 molecule (Raph blood group) n=1 Tax=Hucho hucho TaxID=62062 RepID=A0A4W5KQF8_9TELE